MKLNEYITGQPDNVTFFIGAESNFLFIGNKQRYELDIDTVNNKIKEMHCNYINSASRRLTEYLAEGEPTGDIVEQYWNSAGKPVKKVVPYEKAVARFHERIANCVNNISERSKYMENYINIYDREIKEIRNRDCQNDGVIIIIEGIENGTYWFQHEYDSKIVIESED